LDPGSSCANFLIGLISLAFLFPNMTHKTATATRNIIVGTTTATSDLAIDGGSSPRLASVLDWDNEPVVSESVETIVGNDEEMKFVLTVVGDFVVVNS
jgi:hypothetical protein